MVPCVASAVPAEDAPITAEEYAGYEYAAGLARDLLAFMDEEGISYAVDEEYPGRWAVPFEGKTGDWYVVVSVDPEYVVFVVEVFDIPEDVEPSFYAWLLDKNFDINQAKFGTNEGMLYFNVDAPTRLLDRQEYLDTIRAMVNFVDGIYPEIIERAGGLYGDE
ncbi:MAG: hypothetical protein JSW52_11530 [Candidatus Coatesbacteria bacterium]|nr:MAG: hypothetical protein JSW52_11530 [Candidatus Coatesbacteria bacterium]